MRFKQHIDENEFNVLSFYHIFDDVNEMSDESFQKLQALGHKMGVKVRKTKTFQNLIGTAGKGMMVLLKLVLDYSIKADVLDPVPRRKLESDIKSQFGKLKKQDVIAFFVNLDKTFLGITAIPRHILQNLLGVEFTAYSNWASNYDYIEQNIQKIISVLMDMGDDENTELAKRIYRNVTGKTV